MRCWISFWEMEKSICELGSGGGGGTSTANGDAYYESNGSGWTSTTDTGPGYDCRSVDRVPGAKVSPHGKGIAIDVSAILLADRRRIAVGHEANPQEALFMQTIRRAGCGWFTTILGPGDPDHAEHFHFDILRHGASDNYRICE